MICKILRCGSFKYIALFNTACHTLDYCSCLPNVTKTGANRARIALISIPTNDVPKTFIRTGVTMAIKATSGARAPRGTKTLIQAFFSAADSIPEATRADVVKAALAAIRDQLKDVRDKAKVAKAKAKEKAAKTSVVVSPKVAAAAPKKTPAVAVISRPVKAKATVKPKVKAKVKAKAKPTMAPAKAPEMEDAEAC